MKIVSFGPRHEERPGVLLGGGKILDLATALGPGSESLRAILDAGRFAEARAAAMAPDPACLLDAAAQRIGPPVPDPSKIICLGLNYRDHAEEQSRALPDKPLLFAKPPSALLGPGEQITLPANEAEVDYEVELAFVIARRARHVKAKDASDFVLGYTIMNDVTGRQAQRSERQWLRAKGFEGFAPMGPHLVTADEIPEPHTLGLTCHVNGEERQSSSTSQLIFDIPFLLEYLSRDMTLESGDIISTGTPGGVGVFRDPPVFLKAGDVMRLEIEKIGALENSIAAP